MSQLSTFHVGKYLFGVDVSLVQEVVRLQQMTPVPLAPPEIAGLINLRGEVLTALDLRVRLGLPPAAGVRPGAPGGTDGAAREPVNVVVRVDDPSTVDLERLRGDVREARPVHLPFTVEVRPRNG